MTFTSIFGFIYALLKAIPILESGLKAFFAWYAVKEKEWFYADLHKAVEKAIKTGETRDLENQITSPRAGKPSGDSDSEFDDPK